jgi:hypothetical protein
VGKSTQTKSTTPFGSHRVCRPNTLTVRGAELCADECGAAVHVVGAPLISAGEIEQLLLRIRQMACAGDLAEPCGEIAVMRALSPPNPIAHHRGSASIPALTAAVLAVASPFTRDRFFRVASSRNRTWMPSGSDSIAAKSVLA